jgi:pilus assembly protein Flp/PilA
VFVIRVLAPTRKKGGAGTARLKEREERKMFALKTFFAGLRSRVSREEGQALVEYALILGLVSVVAIALLTAVGADITSLLARVTSALGGAL